jgi:hypothetical protein
MNPEPVAETAAAAGRDEGRAPPVRQPHHAAAGRGEHELVGVTTAAVRDDNPAA